MILDTNAISALSERPDVLEVVAGHVRTFSIPVIVLGEYRFGAARSRYAARYAEWLARLVQVSRVLDVDDQTSKHYARIRQELADSGRPIPSNDAWVAALSRQHRLPVLSHDRHFDAVEGLQRISW